MTALTWKFVRVIFLVSSLYTLMVGITASAEIVAILPDDTSGWTTLSSDTAVTIIDESGPNGVDVLRVSSSSPGDQTSSSPALMQTLQVYRLSATLKTTESGHSPRLAIETMTMAPDTNLGRFPLDITANGEWQTVSTEFRAPWGTKRYRFVVEGADEPGTLDIAEITLEPIPHFTVDGVWGSDGIPKTLEPFRSVHPRLFLDKEEFEKLKESLQNTPRAALRDQILDYADDLAKNGPPAYRAPSDNGYDEQWWMAGNARAMINLGMAWRLTGDRNYLDAAADWAVTTCNYDTWGMNWIDGKDCMTGQNLFGLSVVYDWCYDDLDPGTRDLIRQTVLDRAAFMFDYAAKGLIVPSRLDFSIRPWPEWGEVWLQNHLWVNCAGLLAAGLAMFEETDDAAAWIDFTIDRTRTTMGYLGPDGASHEGVSYWSYGAEHLLKIFELSRSLLGIDFYDSEWMRNTSTYRQYVGLPMNGCEKWNKVVEHGDGQRSESHGPDHILYRLAAEYGDNNAQWFADTLNARDLTTTGTKWMTLLWYEPSISPQAPSGCPTMHHFEDMGFVSARSDWSGDGSLVFFKCGPYIGHKAITEMPYCYSSSHHTHPDQNHFFLFGAGERLIRDDGWIGKYTGQHNTLLVDGHGQDGAGHSIFDGKELHARKARPRILKAVSTPALDHMTGDAAAAYPPDLGLRKFVRHLIYIKPDILIVADDIALDAAHDLELRIHPEYKELEQHGPVVTVPSGDATLRIEALTTQDVDVKAETLDIVNRSYQIDEMPAVRYTTHGDAWRHAVAVTWSKQAESPTQLTLHRRGERWLFDTGTQKAELDWVTGNVRLVKE